MTLQGRLDAYKRQFEAKAPKEVLEIFHRATEDLCSSGILERTLKVGDTAPAFALPNAKGEVLRSTDLLHTGSLVVSFYRGVW